MIPISYCFRTSIFSIWLLNYQFFSRPTHHRLCGDFQRSV